MRTTHALVLAVLASATFAADAAVAGEAIHLTPPLFREQARATQQMRHVSELTTTPQPLAAAKPVEAQGTVKVVAEAAETFVR
jgi:hypothetical protein